MRIETALSVFLLIAPVAWAADEIIVSASAKISSGYVVQSQSSGDVKLDMTNATPVYAGGVVLLSNAATQALDSSAVSAPGYLWIKNASTNLTIRGGPTNAAGILLPLIELRAEEIGMIPRGSEPVYWTATSATNAALQWFLLTR